LVSGTRAILLTDGGDGDAEGKREAGDSEGEGNAVESEVDTEFEQGQEHI
jgi:hypothetical protein